MTPLNLFLYGLTLGSGACMASCGPVLISYCVGTGKNVKHSIAAYGIFSLSRLAVYLTLGTAVFFLGHFLIERFLGSIVRPVYLAGGGIIVIIGLFVFLGRKTGHPVCEKAHSFLRRTDAAQPAVFGAITGVIPCAPLLSVFAYIALASGTWTKAFLLTLVFGLGTIFSPLFLIAACTGLIPRITVHKRLFNILCGGIIIFTGIQLILKSI
jgi:sulfite exporter TauE/SafE